MKPKDLTVVIPAAGVGSRLWKEHNSLPKILYSVGGKTILDSIFSVVMPLAKYRVLVASAQHQLALTDLVRYWPDTCVPLQPISAATMKPTGMLDAVKIGVEQVKTKHTLIVWGDMVGLDRVPWKRLLDNHLLATVPLMTGAYTNFSFSPEGRIKSIQQNREGDEMELGLSDVGIFLFQTEWLKYWLEETPIISCRGAKTKELNFLPVLRYMEMRYHTVDTPILTQDEIPFGINTKEDAEAYENLCLSSK